MTYFKKEGKSLNKERQAVYGIFKEIRNTNLTLQETADNILDRISNLGMKHRHEIERASELFAEKIKREKGVD